MLGQFAKRSRSLGHRRTEDDVSEVMTLVLERLRKNGFRALRTWVAWSADPSNREKSLEDWLRIVLDRVACDYVTRHARRSLLHTLGAAIETGTAVARPAMTDAQAVRELIEHADRDLPPEQAALLRRLLDGQSMEEIADLAGSPREEVTRRMRAAHARLRRWAEE